MRDERSSSPADVARSNAPVLEPTFKSRVVYRDLGAATDWLERAFGFTVKLKATDPANKVVHAELSFGNGLIHIGSEWENAKAPASVGGANTQTISVELPSGLDAHCERARAAGGVIVQEPTDQFHGDRTYRVIDPQGHAWSFSQRLREVSVDEMEAAVPGMKVWRV